MGTYLIHRQTHKDVRKASSVGRSLLHCLWNFLSPYLMNLLNWPFLEAEHWSECNCTVIHKAIPPFLWGTTSRTKSEWLFYPPWRGDKNFIYPTYKLRKNRMDLLTSCSDQFRVGSHTTPSKVPFWASFRSNTTAICDARLSLPHPLPKGRNTHLFLC